MPTYRIGVIGVKTLTEFRVSDVMNRNPVVISPETTALEAAKIMADMGIGSLPVIHPSGRLIGIVTERDLVVKVLARERDPRTPVKEFMTRNLILIKENEPVTVALQLMSRFNIRHLPVVDEKGNLIGILSLRDIEYALV